MTDALDRYADIIGLDRPDDLRTFRRHPRMNVADRAKIFAPFAALRGHEDRLAAEDDRLLRRRRIAFDEEEAYRLAEKLAQLRKGTVAEVTYFVPDGDSEWGWYTPLRGTVERVDEYGQTLRIAGKTIRFDDLAEVRGENILEMGG